MNCKWGDECHTKGCYFNHQSREQCRHGDNCFRTDCFHNHPTILCRFLEQCTNTRCLFRHPQKITPKSSQDIKNADQSTSKQICDIDIIADCKWGNECGTKACFFNHSNRKTCAEGDYCFDKECYFNHITILCKFLDRCTNSKCKFRHPPNMHSAEQSRPGTSAQMFSTEQRLTTASQRTSQKIPTQSNQTYTEKVIAAHEQEIKKVYEKILNILSQNHNDPTENTLLILQALGKQHEELISQLATYNEAISRATNLTGKEKQIQLKREVYRLKSRLPALAQRTQIEERLSQEKSRFLIVQGQTGSGKSSQIAQYVADHPKFAGKKVVCTQPRKIAAVSLATRVSMEYSGGNTRSKPGFQVGYHVGGRKLGGKNCRIEFITEGVMLERIIRGNSQPFEDVGCIIIDEAHERSITCDILLGCFKKEDPRWKDILVIITSATIDLDQFSKFFNLTLPIEIAGRTFPVDISYRPVRENVNIGDAVVNCAFEIHKKSKLSQGDILCFLPGQDDVLRAQGSFEERCNSISCPKEFLATKVFALFGKQDPEIQSQVFVKLPCTTRKIIFATDIAETSITIDGIVFVVDSGVRKEMIYDPKRNISTLMVQTISKSSAIQRAGRSGRTQPGQCFRLYSHQDYEEMEVNSAPEIFRKPLALPILTLIEMGISPREFNWISQPSTEAVEAAEQELRLLGAISVDEVEKTTDLGKLISISQQDPKLVRMVYRGCELGLGVAAITIASILSVANMFFWNGNDDSSKELSMLNRSRLNDAEGDVVTMFRLFERWNDIREGNVEEYVEPEQKVTIVPETTELEEDLILTVDLTDLNGNEGNEMIDDLIDLESESGSETASIGFLESSEIAEVELESNKVKRKNGAKLASAWCRNCFINGKAMGLILSMKTELLAIFKHTNAWNFSQHQDIKPTNTEIQRLIFCGYFLHVARQVHSKNPKACQYYAIHPEVIGNLNFKSAIATCAKIGEAKLPPWIIYDKILRTSNTILPTSSVIEESWIYEECPKFSQLCQTKVLSLPTERVECEASQESIRIVFGKFFCNMTNLEDELSCLLDPNGKFGTIAAYCPAQNKQIVQFLLEEKIQEAMEKLRNQAIEEEYQNGTRVVIGMGFEVKEILFSEDFITIYIRKLPRFISREALSRELERRGISPQKIRTFELTPMNENSFAILNFFQKNEAKKAYENLIGESILGNAIELSTRKAESAQRKYRQLGSTRLKFSWPLSPSTGKATINFQSARNANYCIEQIQNVFYGCRVSAVQGDRAGVPSKSDSKRPTRPLPQVIALKLPKGSSECRFRFRDEEEVEGLDYRITVVDLPLSVDEIEIMTRPNFYTPKWAKIERKVIEKEGTGVDYQQQVQLNEKNKRVIKNVIGTKVICTDFLEKGVNRTGIYVNLEDAFLASKIYQEANDFFQENAVLFNANGHGQPIRVELEYTKSTSIHIGLYQFLKDRIEAVKTLAKNEGINVTENKSAAGSKSKFVIIRFRHPQNKLLDKYQLALAEVMKAEKFDINGRDILFTTSTGRTLLERFSKIAYFHWDSRNHDIWIYGDQEQLIETTSYLQILIENLQTLEIDRLFLLNKKVVNLTKAKDKLELEQLCEKAKLFHYHFYGKNQLFVTESKEVLEKFEATLNEKGFLFRNRETDNKIGFECGICLDEVDPGFIRTSECNHPFCVGCFAGMFSSLAIELPIKCPTCSKQMVISDILKVATPGSLKKFLESALFDYQAKHKDKIAICPQPGCNQMLDVNVAKKGKYGGTFNYCNQCISIFCMECCEATGKIIKSHEGDSCDFARNGLSDQVMRHVKHVQDMILNLMCPKCKVPFFEFDGCAAVTCSSCSTGFCGICLVDCGSSAQAHTHVRNCEKNPNKGGYHVSRPQLNKVHKEKRTCDLKAYLNSIHDIEIKKSVQRALRHDLDYHGIVI